MLTNPGDVLHVPHFIQAPNPQALQKLMLENNLKNLKEYKYFDIGVQSGKWYAWFYEVAGNISYLAGKEVKK